MFKQKGKELPKIIFEDSSLLILGKPAYWVVTDAKSVKVDTIQSWLKQFDYPLAHDFEKRSGIVHRIDKETSGVLVVAKTAIALRRVQKQFKQRKVNKEYLALVHGDVKSDGEVVAPVGRLPWNRERFGVLPGGREAVTRYRVISNFQISNFKYSLLRLFPKTGRTHQIRIHLKHINHPIVADTFYAGRKTARADREWCPRLFLHAAKISLKHPKTGKIVSYESPLPDDLEQALTSL